MSMLQFIMEELSCIPLIRTLWMKALSERYHRFGNYAEELAWRDEKFLHEKLGSGLLGRALQKFSRLVPKDWLAGYVGYVTDAIGSGYCGLYKKFYSVVDSKSDQPISEEDKHYIAWLALGFVNNALADNMAKMNGVRDPQIVDCMRGVARHSANHILAEADCIPRGIRGAIFDDVNEDHNFLGNSEFVQGSYKST